MKWQNQHIQTKTFSSFDPDKNVQAVFLENPQLVELAMWTSFKKVVSPIKGLVLYETNQYANKDKNKPQFKVSLKELEDFIELIFFVSLQH